MFRFHNLLTRSRLRGLAVAAGLLATIYSTLSVFPHSLAYFNEASGGPENGHKHLLGSNLDWGQDLIIAEEAFKQIIAEEKLKQNDPVRTRRVFFLGPNFRVVRHWSTVMTDNPKCDRIAFSVNELLSDLSDRHSVEQSRLDWKQIGNTLFYFNGERK
jgi:hypothetical protein